MLIYLFQKQDNKQNQLAKLIQDDEGMFEEDYNTGFVKTLLRVQNNVVNMPGGKEHFDIYLAEAIYPTLVPALESLAREIDRLTSTEGKKDL